MTSKPGTFTRPSTYRRPAPRSSRRPSPTFNPFGGETKVNTENPDRGPVLIIAGGNDNTAPTAITHATYKYLAKHNDAVTEIVDVPDRGHSLTIDHGWREVAEIALGFVKRNS